MTLINILVLILVALIGGLFAPGRWRGGIILITSLLALYWLQPEVSIRNLDFWLPTASLGLVMLGWAITRPAGEKMTRIDLLTGLGALGLVALVALLRYAGPVCCLTPTRPPVFLQVLAGLLILALLVALALRFSRGQRWVMVVGFSIVLFLFLVLKTSALSLFASQLLRQLSGQQAALAKASDLSWLGFSYIAFRLLHTLRDRQTGRLPALSLPEYASYVLFFPALTAGPIDRADRFVKDLRRLLPSNERLASVGEGARRITLGLFRKFVLADVLAMVALSQDNFAQVTSTPWMWLLLYAYALRIYFDFSGYTDIAIGLGLLLGIKLPENFDRPYLKPNLTTFWNSWHMTLAQWFRSYFFNPLTRALRTRQKPLPPYLVILVGQLATFALIGLWHGVTWNFLIWGAWHGVGLFIHNRWSEFSRPRLNLSERPVILQGILVFLGGFLTFNYVALGWVWFALPGPAQSWQVMLRLFGISS